MHTHAERGHDRKINSFPAEAGPTVGASPTVEANPTGCMRFLGRTGFSREGASMCAGSFADRPFPCGERACSRMLLLLLLLLLCF